jgi:hypothetical protein
LSESDVIGELKDLMPYIIATVAIVCLAVLRAVNQISEEDFWRVFLLLIGYVSGEVTGVIRFRRMRKMLKELER